MSEPEYKIYIVSQKDGEEIRQEISMEDFYKGVTIKNKVEDMSQLKPCPFCGSTDIRFEHHAGWSWPYNAYCNGCAATTCNSEDKEDAAKAWNTRPADKEFEDPTQDIGMLMNREW